MNVYIETTVPQSVRQLNDMKNKQVPYAIAVALTRVAKEARDDYKRALPALFTLRNRWVQRGIRYVPAKKGVRPQSVVYSKDAFMALQETGGTKRAKGRLAIPKQGKGSPRTRSGRYAKRKGIGQLRPKNIMKAKRGFEGRTKSGKRALYLRDRRRGTTELMYVLQKTAKLKPRAKFAVTVTASVNHNFGKHLGRELAKAIAQSNARAVRQFRKRGLFR